jgi:hypothetical protein
MFLGLATPANLPSGTANATYFTVTTFTYNAAVGAGPRIIFSNGTDADSQSRQISDRQNTLIYFNCTGGGTIGGNNAFAIVTSTQTPHIITGTLNNQIASIWYTGNPGSGTNADQQSVSIPLNTANSLAYVGRNIQGGSGYGTYNGNISEILVFNTALSNTDRQTIEGYLAWKWGLQASLPGGHPYASAAP